jgi:Fur family transcriptional regulator, ferric uptake regulator
MSCLKTLKAKGLKLTPQRILIAEIFHDTKDHLTAEEIIVHVRNRMPGVNKSTIYRTLELLEGAGCIYKSTLGDESIYHHKEEGHHHHLVCRRCGKTIDCEENIFVPVQKSLREKYDFQVDFRHLVMSGVCNDCKNKKSQTT